MRREAVVVSELIIVAVISVLVGIVVLPLLIWKPIVVVVIGLAIVLIWVLVRIRCNRIIRGRSNRRPTCGLRGVWQNMQISGGPSLSGARIIRIRLNLLSRGRACYQAEGDTVNESFHWFLCLG